MKTTIGTMKNEASEIDSTMERLNLELLKKNAHIDQLNDQLRVQVSTLWLIEFTVS